MYVDKDNIPAAITPIAGQSLIRHYRAHDKKLDWMTLLTWSVDRNGVANSLKRFPPMIILTGGNFAAVVSVQLSSPSLRKQQITLNQFCALCTHGSFDAKQKRNESNKWEKANAAWAVCQWVKSYLLCTEIAPASEQFFSSLRTHFFLASVDPLPHSRWFLLWFQENNNYHSANFHFIFRNSLFPFPILQCFCHSVGLLGE